MSLFYQCRTDSFSLVLWDYRKRSKRKNRNISNPRFCKHNVSDNDSIYFRNERQLGDIGIPVSKSIDQILLVAVRMVSALKSCLYHIINTFVITFIFSSYQHADSPVTI